MACKLECPKCRRVLKEQGDEMKSARGEYAIDPRPDGNWIRCLACGEVGPVAAFDDLLLPPKRRRLQIARVIVSTDLSRLIARWHQRRGTRHKKPLSKRGPPS